MKIHGIFLVLLVVATCFEASRSQVCVFCDSPDEGFINAGDEVIIPGFSMGFDLTCGILKQAADMEALPADFCDQAKILVRPPCLCDGDPEPVIEPCIVCDVPFFNPEFVIDIEPSVTPTCAEIQEYGANGLTADQCDLMKQFVADYCVCEEPAGEAPTDEAPVEAPVEAPADEAPVGEAPADEAPVGEAPVDEAPVGEAPVGEAPVDEAPVDEAPVDEAPVDEEPTVYESCSLCANGESFTNEDFEIVIPGFQSPIEPLTCAILQLSATSGALPAGFCEEAKILARPPCLCPGDPDPPQLESCVYCDVPFSNPDAVIELESLVTPTCSQIQDYALAGVTTEQCELIRPNVTEFCICPSAGDLEPRTPSSDGASEDPSPAPASGDETSTPTATPDSDASSAPAATTDSDASSAPAATTDSDASSAPTATPETDDKPTSSPESGSHTFGSMTIHMVCTVVVVVTLLIRF